MMYKFIPNTVPRRDWISQSTASSIDACRKDCDNRPDICRSFVYDPKTRDCYLYDSLFAWGEKTLPQKGMVLAIQDGPPSYWLLWVFLLFLFVIILFFKCNHT